MWHEKAVLKFLRNRGTSTKELEGVSARIFLVEDGNGQIPNRYLVDVMGSEKLAQEFIMAWDKDPALQSAGSESS